MEDKLRSEDKWSSRAIIARCSDQTYYRLLDFIRTSPDCYLVFSKSSNLKLMIVERGW